MQQQPNQDIADLALIKPDLPVGSADAEVYAEEFNAYEQYDHEEDLAYERRVRQAYLVRELAQIDEIIKARKTYADKIFSLVVWWLAGIGIVLLLAGFEICSFKLEKSVLLALIGGTTLNVLGIFTIVANFLFPRNGHMVFTGQDRKKSSKPLTTKPKSSAGKKNAAKEEQGTP